jgi:deazaflavin-dependent oxidoreductase (nitroreductase family)
LDWLGAGLPTEGTNATRPRAGTVARTDVPTCGLDEELGTVSARVHQAGWNACVVVNDARVVMGLLRADELAGDPTRRIENAMRPGPSTFRPYVGITEMAGYMATHKLENSPVTTSDGRLVGLLVRTDAERAARELEPAATDERSTAMSEAKPHYREPGWFTRNVFNRIVRGLTSAGISLLGSRVLEVRGRQSGEPRRTPVNLLTFDGDEYLVSARGEGQWVRNVRAADGQLDLLVGRRRTHYQGRELSDDEKVPVLRAYLRRWKSEVGVFFEGVGPDSSDEEIRAIAHKHPAFALSKRSDQ